MQDELGEEESGKETDYKHLEHGLEISGSRYAMKGFGTYKERLHTMAPRAISTATSNEHGTGIQEGTRGGGGGEPFHSDMAKIKQRSLLDEGGRGDLWLSVRSEWFTSY